MSRGSSVPASFSVLFGPSETVGWRDERPKASRRCIRRSKPVLVAACLFALRQNVKLRSAINYDQALLTPRNGTVVPPLVGYDWTGAPQAIVYGQDRHPTLVYTFSKECGYCQENWRAMRSLQALAPTRLRIVYIDTVGLRPSATHQLQEEVDSTPW
jgi:hypothetical protein